VQAEVQIFLDVRRIENRDAAGLEYVLALGARVEDFAA